jgi:hypothetical protein
VVRRKSQCNTSVLIFALGSRCDVFLKNEGCFLAFTRLRRNRKKHHLKWRAPEAQKKCESLQSRKLSTSEMTRARTPARSGEVGSLSEGMRAAGGNQSRKAGYRPPDNWRSSRAPFHTKPSGKKDVISLANMVALRLGQSQVSGGFEGNCVDELSFVPGMRSIFWRGEIALTRFISFFAAGHSKSTPLPRSSMAISRKVVSRDTSRKRLVMRTKMRPAARWSSYLES